MHSPRDSHLALLKRILRYVKGTLDFGLRPNRTTQLQLSAYTDADWAGCPDTRRSTSGFAVFLGDTLVSWSSKRQNTVSRSSAEAEYRGVANAVAECSWLRHLLGELHCDIHGATIAYCDNVSSVYMARNPIHHRRTKLAHRTRRTLRTRKSCHRRTQGRSNPQRSAIRGHLHEGSTIGALQRLPGQSLRRINHCID